MGWNNPNLNYNCVFLKVPFGNVQTITFQLNNNNHICNDEAYIYSHSNSCVGFGLCHNHISYDFYLNYFNYNANMHKLKCPICQANLYTEPHSYNYDFEWLSNTTHYSYCACGRTVVRPHSIDGHSNQLNYCFECHGYATGGIIVYENINQEEDE